MNLPRRAPTGSPPPPGGQPGAVPAGRAAPAPSLIVATSIDPGLLRAGMMCAPLELYPANLMAPAGSLADYATRPPPRRPGPLPSTTLYALQCEILEAIARNLPLQAVALTLCHRVEAILPDIACSVLLVDSERRLYSLAAPSLPAAFSDAVTGLLIGPDVGSCGAGAFYGVPIEVTDIATDPRWTLYNELPLAAGWRACWSSPILSRDGTVIGTFAFYFRECRSASQSERQIVSASVDLCALAIERWDVQATLESTRERLERTNEQLDLAMHSMSQGLCLFDADDALVVMNQRFAQMHSLPVDSVTPGMSFQDLTALIQATTGYRDLDPEQLCSDHRARLARGGASTGQHVLRDGRVVSVTATPVAGGGWVATYEDITERQAAEARIAHMARHDALTGLPNRLTFHEHLRHAVAASRPGAICALLFLDLDGFKAVNDALGHPAGDRLLHGVAARLQHCIGPGDIVTRLGGDEFAILRAGLPNPRGAVELANCVIAILREPFEVDGKMIDVGASIGIALAPDDATSADDMLKNADLAMYRAKNEERGHYCFFEPDMHASAQARRALEMDLRRALAKGEFELYYQPIYNIQAGGMTGLEALIRWHHPRRGLVPPGAFINAAEESGLIIPLGAWVLHQACRDAAAWPGHVRVAVNISAGQFRRGDLAASVRQALEETGLEPHRLELEITETALISDTGAVRQTLQALRDLGVHISMDDFGTGYCSLSYLRRFPFNRLKVDKSFIDDMFDKDGNQVPESVAIVRAIIGLGRTLGLTTTAEGVETPAQLALLRLEGCTDIQGYLFSKPRPVDAVAEMLSLVDA